MVFKLSTDFVNNLIKRKYILAFLVYLFVILGLLIKCYFNVHSFIGGLILPMQIATFYSGIIIYVLSKDLNNLRKLNLTHEELENSIYAIENKFNTKFHNCMKIFLILLISILLGCFGINSIVTSLTDLIVHISASFGASLVCMFIISYDFGISKDNYNSVLTIFAALSLSAIALKVFTSVFLREKCIIL